MDHLVEEIYILGGTAGNSQEVLLGYQNLYCRGHSWQLSIVFAGVLKFIY
jgi:hypothetical protein